VNSLSSENEPGSGSPRQCVGTGKVIDGLKYGHVEVTVFPRPELSDLSVVWHVQGGTIPEAERGAVVEAAQRFIETAATGQLRCGVRVFIEGGSFHDTLDSAHEEAVRLAIDQALRRGNFYRQV